MPHEIGFVQQFPVFPREIFIVIFFQPRRPRIVRGGKAEHLTEGIPFRINAGVVPGIIDAVRTCRLELFDGALVRVPGHRDLRRPDRLQFFEEGVPVHPERVREQPRRARLVRNGVGAGKDRIRRAVFREHDAVAVGYQSALRDDGNLPHPLVERPIPQLAAPRDLHVKETGRQNAKKKGYRRKHGR